MRKSKQLQSTATSILETVGGGMENHEVKAIRGVGYAVLALLQFLRESEPATIKRKSLECNPCDCDCDEKMSKM